MPARRCCGWPSALSRPVQSEGPRDDPAQCLVGGGAGVLCARAGHLAEQAKAKEGQLQVRWNQLQLEQGALATSSLIDARARKGLSMQPAPPQRTLYLVTEPTAEPAGMVPVR
ncbi:MAG: cell division protein FtsL [Quisquiliibacterium sp.]